MTSSFTSECTPNRNECVCLLKHTFENVRNTLLIVLEITQIPSVLLQCSMQSPLNWIKQHKGDIGINKHIVIIYWNRSQ